MAAIPDCSTSRDAPRWSPEPRAVSAPRWHRLLPRRERRCSSPISTGRRRGRGGEDHRHGRRADSVALDVRDRAAADAAAETAAALTDGTLHILVNNAGVTAPAMFEDMQEESSAGWSTSI